jgi:hypothetical protein
MSVLEVFEVWYVDSGEEKCQCFDWFNFDGVKKFVKEHKVVEIRFKAEGLPDSPAHKVKEKNVYVETIPKEKVDTLSQAWIDNRRKQY